MQNGLILKYVTTKMRIEPFQDSVTYLLVKTEDSVTKDASYSLLVTASNLSLLLLFQP